MLPLVSTFLLLWSAPASAEEGGYSDRALHPADGPDADVRVFIDEDAVRVQIVVNLVFLDMMMSAPHEREDWVDPVEYDTVREAMFDYFSRVNAVRANGVELEARDEGFEIGEPEMSLLPLFARFGMKALFKLRISLDYPLESAAREVELVWGAYPPDIIAAAPGEEPSPLQITAQLSALGEETLIFFRADEPSHVWTNTGDKRESRFLALPELGAAAGSGGLPLLSATLIGLWVLLALWVHLAAHGGRRLVWLAAPAVLVTATLTSGMAQVSAPGFSVEALDDGTADTAYAEELFEALHQNMYRAFDYRDVDKVYDALERSVAGELLEELFTDVYDSLVLHDDGGAVCRIKEVTPLKTEVLGSEERDGVQHLDIEAHWQVFGAVFHWGHSHTRTIEKKARYTLRNGEDGWRISAHEMLDFNITETDPGVPPAAAPEGTNEEREL